MTLLNAVHPLNRKKQTKPRTKPPQTHRVFNNSYSSYLYSSIPSHTVKSGGLQQRVSHRKTEVDCAQTTAV